MATAIKAVEDAPAPLVHKKGMTPSEAAYMRGGAEPQAGSVPWSTSRYLNSPLFVHAFTTHALRRMGKDLPMTYDIPDISRGVADVMDYEEYARLIEVEKQKNPEFKAWLDERRISRYDPKEMGHYADGTLGAAIRDFMLASGYDIEFVDKGITPANDLQYLMKKGGEAHDIQHIVTGFGPNSAGEHALIMMNIAGNANYFSPELASFLSRHPFFLASAGMMRISLHYPAGVPLLLEAQKLGTQAGQNLKKPLHLVNWEEYLDWQLDDIAADLGFTRGPDQEWLAQHHLFHD